MRAHSSRPLVSGSFTSSSTRAGAREVTSSIAMAPLAASMTSKPAIRRIRVFT
jgi:hypothetical protein